MSSWSEDPGVQEAAQLASEIREKLVSGEDFTAVVSPYAESGATSSVIELGWVRQGDLEPSLDVASWKLEVGEISQPLLARGGLHLVQLLEKKEPQMRRFKEVEDQIRSRQQDKKYQEELAKFLEELVAQSYVKVNPPPETPEVTAELLLPSQDDPLGRSDGQRMATDEGLSESSTLMGPASDAGTKPQDSLEESSSP